MSQTPTHRLTLLSAAACVIASVCVPVAAQETAPARKAFRVCQDPNNLPFSSTQGNGIENKIAELFAKELGLPVEYYSFPQRLAFVRNTLRYKLPGQDYPCDIIMGVPAGYDQVSVTKPYYRSTYALVYAPGKGLDGVQTIDDFLKVDRAVLGKLRIGLYDRSPASEWLNRHQLVEQGVPYPIMSADPAQYPGEIIEKDIAAGKIDAAIVWGPIAGYYAKRVTSMKLTVVPMRSEKNIKFDFPMAMGVRYGEREWKQQIESLIDKTAPQITAILTDFGVPLVEEPAAAR
ncbi:MAG TPA: substrate-binding domain-containing protein [Methylibium sp.]|nr:substrate-binding domain-containing protein [Methylibium sp.]